MRLVAPSILAADFLHLGGDVDFVNEHADIFHLDVMDGTLVPNISFGVPVVEAIASRARKPLDVHLMVVNPQKWFEKFASLGAGMISFHLEAARLAGLDPIELVGQIQGLGAKAGVAINPDVPVEELFPLVGKADFLLVMSVFAGFGGQKFIPETLERIATLRKEIERRGESTLIEVDGGIGPANVEGVVSAGAQILVAGSSVLKAPDRVEAVRILRGE